MMSARDDASLCEGLRDLALYALVPLSLECVELPLIACEDAAIGVVGA